MKKFRIFVKIKKKQILFQYKLESVLYLIERMFRNTLGGKDLKNKIGVIEAETPTVQESGITNLDFADDFAVL